MHIINYENYLTEAKLGDVLVSLGKKRGFRVVAQWPINKQRCDFALFRPDTDIPFAVYEFDGFITIIRMQHSAAMLRKISR